MEEVFFRTPYNHDSNEWSDRCAIPVDKHGESMAVQSMAGDADLNVLMQRFGVIAALPENPRPPMVGDFSEIVDFRTALDAVRDAQEAFMEFPASVRSRFGNDPQQMLDFFRDERNADEAEKLGLFSKEAIARRAQERAAAVEREAAVEAALEAARAAKTPKA